MGDKNREIAEYYKKQKRGEHDDELLDRIVGGSRRERKAKAEERKAKRDLESQTRKQRRRKNTYTVQSGDSWFSIAGSELGDQRYAGELARLNPGFDVLNPGVELVLPEVYEDDEAPLITNEEYERLEDIQAKGDAAKGNVNEITTLNSVMNGRQDGEREYDTLQAYIDGTQAIEGNVREVETLVEIGAFDYEEPFNVGDYESEAQDVAQMLKDMGYVPPQENGEEPAGSGKVAAPAQDEVLQEEDPNLGQADFPLVGLTGDVSPEIRKNWKTVEETFSGEEEPESEETQVIEPQIGLFEQKEPSEALYFTYVISGQESGLLDVEGVTGVPFEEIMKTNEMDTDIINKGQVLYIPIKEVTSLLDDATYIYSEASRQLLNLAIAGDYPIDSSIRPKGIDTVYSGADNQIILDNMSLIMEFAAEYDLDTNQLAYILATAQIESGMGGDMQERYDGSDAEGYFNDKYGVGTSAGNDLGNLFDSDGYKFRGRGFVQLTGRAGYKYYNELLGEKYGVDIFDNPDLLSDNPKLAAEILVDGIVNGTFKSFHYIDQNNKAESEVTAEGMLGIVDYDLSDRVGFSVAREIVNSDSPEDFAALAADYACVLSTLCSEDFMTEGINCGSQQGC